MSEKRKATIKTGTQLSIGGKKYNSDDVARYRKNTKEVQAVTGKENIPRDIRKEVVNQYGTVKTNDISSGLSSSSSSGVKTQVQQKETVGTGRNSYLQEPSKLKQETKSVQTVSGYENSPRSIQKEVVNQYGTIRTGNIDGYRSKIKTGSSPDISGRLTSGGRVIYNKARDTIKQSDDLGAQSTGMLGDAVDVGYSSFKMAQQISPIMTGTIVKVGKGSWDIAATGYKATLTVSRTASVIRYNSQFVSMDNPQIKLSILKKQAKASGLTDTLISKRIVNSIERFQNTCAKIKTGVKVSSDALKYTKATVKQTVININGIYRGVINGKVTSKVAYDVLKKARMNAILGIKKGSVVGAKAIGKGLFKGARYGGSVAIRKGLPTSVRLGSKGVMGVGGMLANTDDLALQGVGNAMIGANIGLKTAKEASKLTVRGIKTTARGGKKIYKGGKFAWNGLKFAREKGLRAAWQKAGNKTMQGLIRAGKSFVSFAVNAIRAAGTKLLIPLIVVCVIVTAMTGSITTPIMAVSSIFSGIFSTSDTNMEYDISEYLMDPQHGVPKMTNDYIQSLSNELKNSKSKYDIVRLYSNSGGSEVITPDANGIRSVFPTDNQIVNMIQPIFNAVLLMDYDLEPTEEQALKLSKEIYSTLFRTSKSTSKEYCGQNIENGEGTVEKHKCGHIHALNNCPNVLTGKHSRFTCEDCCYKYCDGHENFKTYTVKNSELEKFLKKHKNDKIVSQTPIDDGDENEDNDKTQVKISYITYCNGCKDACNGYRYCGGHDVLSVTLNIDGAYELLAKYFTDPIEELSNIQNRTEKQEEQLQNLKDYYEICLEMMGEVSSDFNGGMNMGDLSGVQFVNGTRKGCQPIIDLALTQVGQVGGKPYWSYYGFSSRVEWCACFVHWVMKTSGKGDSWPTTSNNAYCPTLANWFKDNGRWGNKDYTDIVAGDTIFFDWQGDGITDHIGLVIGRDQNKIYTVEGNSGDAVKVLSYSIGSSVIYGYGLMNY